jgi:hypothetical protein
VHGAASKPEIRDAIEAIWDVEVLKVNTLNRPGKRRRVRGTNRMGRTASQKRAISATWGLSVRKNGRFMLTQYRAGNNVACASDINGRTLKQRSVARCANQGWSAKTTFRAWRASRMNIS